MYKILRAVKNISLVKATDQETNDPLIYYLDNGEDVSEYFDELDAQHFFAMDDERFLKEAKEYF